MECGSFISSCINKRMETEIYVVQKLLIVLKRSTVQRRVNFNWIVILITMNPRIK